jgi:hypothetical protein
MSTSQILVDESEVNVEVVDQSVRVMAIEHPSIVILGDSGPQGPQGIPGPTQVLGYVFDQTSPSDEWTIIHGLDFVPSITVVDSAGSVVEGDYSYPNENTVIATFAGAFAGKAYLS